MPRSAARLLTAVGLRRVSIGPPISVIDSGTKGSLLGFHDGNRRHHRHRRLAYRDDMHVAAELMQHLDDVIDIIIEVEAAFGQRHHARVGPVGDVDLMGRQEGFDRAAQQRRVMPGHRRHDQHARLRLRSGRVSLRSKYSRRQNGFSQIERTSTGVRTPLTSVVVEIPFRLAVAARGALEQFAAGGDRFAEFGVRPRIERILKQDLGRIRHRARRIERRVTPFRTSSTSASSVPDCLRPPVAVLRQIHQSALSVTPVLRRSIVPNA